MSEGMTVYTLMVHVPGVFVRTLRVPAWWWAMRAWREQVKCHEVRQHMIDFPEIGTLRKEKNVASYSEIPTNPFPSRREADPL